MRTKAELLHATRRLMEQGNLNPNAKEIAEKAGYSERTVFEQWVSLCAIQGAALADKSCLARVGEIFLSQMGGVSLPTKVEDFDSWLKDFCGRVVEREIKSRARVPRVTVRKN